MTMTHNPKVSGSVELKFNDLPLDKSRKNGNKPSAPPSTHNGHDLWKEVEFAVNEKEISQLRQLLRTITIESPSEASNPDDLFNLTESLDIREFLENYSFGDVNPEFNGKPLPRIHLHQHHRNSSETTHHLYEDQQRESDIDSVQDAGNESDGEWQEIEQALGEKDVMSLRDSLRHLSTSIDTGLYSTEDIENYREGKMAPDEVMRFEAELENNSELKVDLRLDSELEEAIAEQDIMDLRESMGKIVQKQNSTSRTLEEIESFLEGDMSELSRISFIDELLENNGLRNEIKVVQDINSALSEKTVIQLRDNLQRISREVYQQQLTSFFSFKKGSGGGKKRAIVAAVIVFTFGISTLLQNTGDSGRRSYDRFYKVPEAVSSFRSNTSNLENDLDKGFEYYQNRDFIAALGYFDRIIESDAGYPVAQFYSGASFQNMEQFQKAIPHYTNVIRHNDNIFVEQATWYKALCHVRTGDKSLAISELKEIVKQNGFYGKDASLLIKKLH